jgi:hypothetical protein
MDSGLSITGGMCGDDARFEKHLPRTRKIQRRRSGSYGFYGSTLGFRMPVTADGFPGPERVITKAEANILYEIDGQPALDLYKKIFRR